MSTQPTSSHASLVAAVDRQLMVRDAFITKGIRALSRRSIVPSIVKLARALVPLYGPSKWTAVVEEHYGERVVMRVKCRACGHRLLLNQLSAQRAHARKCGGSVDIPAIRRVLRDPREGLRRGEE